MVGQFFISGVVIKNGKEFFGCPKLFSIKFVRIIIYIHS